MATPSSPVRLSSDQRDDIHSEPVYDAGQDSQLLALAASQLAQNSSVVSQALSRARSSEELERDGSSQQSATFVWGTTINTADSLHSIWQFFTIFKKDPNDSSPYYVQLIEKVRVPCRLSANSAQTPLPSFSKRSKLLLILIVEIWKASIKNSIRT